MKKKKRISLLLAAVLLILLTSCGEKTPGSGDTASASMSSAQSEVNDAQPSQPNQIAGGSDQENAESVPLDTKLSGKTKHEEHQWFSFTTDETENATYKITLVNQTQETGSLDLCLYDAEGKKVQNYTLVADSDGKAATYTADLMPDTTYFTDIWAEQDDIITYSLIIRSPEGQKPENNVAQPGPEPTDGLEIPSADNQDEAQVVPLNTKLAGKVDRNKGQWFAFSTNSAENATYRLTTVNMTRGTGNLNLHVYDQYGEFIKNYTSQANQEGKATTFDLELPPNTSYYIYIWANEGDTIAYTLTVHAPEDTNMQR